MTSADSYLGRLRSQIGSQLILTPGAMVVVMRADGRVLMTRRADDATWCIPGGSCEPGSSFAETAVGELHEETGLVIQASDLLAFASLSRAALHTVTYPNGDVTQSFSLCFLVTAWAGEPRADDSETTAVAFVDPDDPPQPVHGPTTEAMRLLRRYQSSGRFALS